jgi:hypothetical protein
MNRKLSGAGPLLCNGSAEFDGESSRFQPGIERIISLLWIGQGNSEDGGQKAEVKKMRR